MFRRGLVAIAITVGVLSGQMTPAAAGVVATDAQTAVREILFPIVGPNSYSDTFGACRDGCSRGHEGTDIMSPKLTKLIAVRDARVKWLKNTATADGKNGNYLMLEDAQGWEYWYIHINNDSPGTDDGANPTRWIFTPGIEVGAQVFAGQHIAYVGDSGNAEWTPPHLHFEIHKPDGTIINPYKSLRAAPELSAPLSGPADAEMSESDRAFVDALAEDFLGRSAESFDHLLAHATLAFGQPRSAVVKRYANSQEWVSVLVTRLYQSTLGRDPDATGLGNWVRAILAGMTPAEAASRFYASSEYYQRAGGNDRDWVTDLYQEILLREPDSSGLDNWVHQMTAGQPRTWVTKNFYGSWESRSTRVAGLYEALLGRAPDATGHDNWTRHLSTTQDIELAVLLAASTEYYHRADARF